MIESEKSNSEKTIPAALATIAIVGSPNVGKSVLFHHLTGRYVVVSNYPGTTVEVSRGRAQIGAVTVEVIDTPGMYSFLSLSEEENVSRRILMSGAVSLVLHVVDAKNLERMLSLTFELLEASLPVVLVLNMMDEARSAGLTLRAETLRRLLGIPVVETVLTSGEGVEELEKVMAQGLSAPKPEKGFPPANPVEYPFETALGKVEGLLARDYGIGKRLAALLLFQEDAEMKRQIAGREPQIFLRSEEIIREEKHRHSYPFEYETAVQRAARARKIVEEAVGSSGPRSRIPFNLDAVLMNPFTGIPILLFILYWTLYKFVGVFGAGTVVGYIEGHVFQAHVNPFMISLTEKIIPWPVLRDLFTGEYGLFTLAIRYAVALILPIVSFFFIVFSLFEDTGYLPRLAMLADRTFKKIGLSGRAIIPMVLGLGCDTMATMVTRTLPTKRERIVATFLLTLAIPCSAQLGVIFALLSGRPRAMALWAGVIGFIFILVGFLISRLLPGEKPSFYMEIPPLRLPKLSNIIIKTCARVDWYLREVIPLFLLASFLIWLGKLTHLFEAAVKALEKPVQWMGLPVETAPVFLFGFFRRDYGAAGLYDLNRAGALSGIQLVVACVALTLFLPCIAQFLMNIRERGWKIGIAMSVFVLFFAFGTACGLNFFLRFLGVSI